MTPIHKAAKQLGSAQGVTPTEIGVVLHAVEQNVLMEITGRASAATTIRDVQSFPKHPDVANRINRYETRGSNLLTSWIGYSVEDETPLHYHQVWHYRMSVDNGSSDYRLRWQGVHMTHPYTQDYYSDLQRGVRSSARVIVPLVLELVAPTSVIDIGCGTGEWLAVFREHGVEDVWGVDGAYVSPEMLKIPRERFIPTDLKQPFHMDRRFDLVVSLEVAEHLPSEYARTLIDSLTGLGPVILFSAAIPHQGGEEHVNEQWPEYWVQLFRDREYIAIDCLRKKVWCSERVEAWYAQNTLMFAAREYLENCPKLKKEYELSDAAQLSMVHPRMYIDIIDRIEFEARVRNRLRRIVKRILPPRIKRPVKYVVRRSKGIS